MGKHIDMSNPMLDLYLVEVGTRETEPQRGLRAATRNHPRAGMQIGPDQGQFMAFLVKLLNVRRAIEIGTFTGYSALSVAAALPADGQLIACDISREFTDIGRPFWKAAGVDSLIDLRLGPATATLDLLLAEGGADSFDMAFIDADKEQYDAYYERCLKLVRPGGIILLDNMLWGGAVVDTKDQTADTKAIRALNGKIHGDDRVDMCLLPVGDGINLVRRRPE